jgi:hypothetical protein
MYENGQCRSTIRSPSSTDQQRNTACKKRSTHSMHHEVWRVIPALHMLRSSLPPILFRSGAILQGRFGVVLVKRKTSVTVQERWMQMQTQMQPGRLESHLGSGFWPMGSSQLTGWCIMVTLKEWPVSQSPDMDPCVPCSVPGPGLCHCVHVSRVVVRVMPHGLLALQPSSRQCASGEDGSTVGCFVSTAPATASCILHPSRLCCALGV